MSGPDPVPGERRAALVITVSTRAAQGAYADTAGPFLADGLRDLDLAVDGPTAVPDGPEVGWSLAAGIERAYDLIVTSGGTGISPADRTPEATAPLLDRELPGIAEQLRARGVQQGVPAAMLSRGVVGVAGPTLVVNLAGSRGAARDGLAVLAPVLGHALDQLAGGDH